MSFSEIENDTLNQATLNEIKMNENNYIYEVPGLNHRGVRKKPQNKTREYNKGANSLASIFLSRRVKLIVTSERLNIFKFCLHQSKVE